MKSFSTMAVITAVFVTGATPVFGALCVVIEPADCTDKYMNYRTEECQQIMCFNPGEDCPNFAQQVVNNSYNTFRNAELDEAGKTGVQNDIQITCVQKMPCGDCTGNWTWQLITGAAWTPTHKEWTLKYVGIICVGVSP